jgi:hypothetical protein
MALGLLLLLPCAARSGAQSLTFSPLAPPPPPVNLVQNGNFASGFSNWSLFGSGQSVVPSGGSYPTVPASSAPGTMQAQLEGLQAGSNLSNIHQVIALTPGKTYDLTFWLAATGSNYKGLNVEMNPPGQYQTSVFNKLINGSSGYTEYTTQFKATSSSETLQFAYAVPMPQYGNAFYVTDVNINVVTPPPPTLLATLAGGMLGGLRMLRARRRRQSA